MEIETQAEILLRGAGYTTYSPERAPTSVSKFESEALIGFLYVFNSPQELLQVWRQAQAQTLTRYQPTIRLAGDKAWNIYSVFLCQDESAELRPQIEAIEEDFSLTRKIARSGIRVPADLRWALLPLLPLSNHATIVESDYIARLQNRLKDVRPEGVKAFLGSSTAIEVARILAGS
jgi:hypothetical protein